VNLKKTISFSPLVNLHANKSGLIIFFIFVLQVNLFSQLTEIKQTEICLWKLPSIKDTFLCPGQSLQIHLDSIAGSRKKDTFPFFSLEPLDGNVHKPFNPLKINLPVKDLPKEKIDFKDYKLVRICLDIYTPKASDLEVWLIPPSGNTNNVVELISPGNASGNPDFLQTCFTPSAFNAVSSGISPYTGEFSVAGNWSGLIGEELNGNWQLWVSDRLADAAPGLVQSISLVFETKPNYQIKWTPKEGISCDSCKSPIFSPIKSTTYQLQLINNQGCVFSDTLTIDYRDKSFGPAFTCEPKGPGLMDVSWQLPSLLLKETYAASILQKGRPPIVLATTGNKKFSLNGLSSKDSIAVTFKLPKMDGVMCQAIDTTYYCVFPPCDLALIEKQNSPISCYGSEDGMLEFSFSKGFPPISLTKDGQNSPLKIDRLKAGTHSFIATDFLGCQSSFTAKINEPQPIKANISLIKPVLCFDLPGAQLKANPTGGNGGYTFRWQPDGGTTETTGLIKQGSYTLVITDSKSCIGKDTFFLNSPTPISATINTTPTICSGSATGSIQVNVTGGIAPYQYLWNNGDKNSEMTNLPAGLYKLTVTDQNNCNFSVTATIAQGASVLKIDSTNITPVSCYGNRDGIAKIFVSGGTKPYQIKWNDPLAQVGNLANRLATGSYFININDAKGCTIQYQVLITSPTLLQMNIQSRDLTCLNKNDGEMEVFPTGGVLPYKILWSDGSTEKKRVNLNAGNFAITLTDANNCEENDLVVINNPINPLKISAVQTYKGCFGKKENTVQTTVTGGSPEYFIRWSHGFTGLLSSNLDTSLYVIKVNDAQGCFDSTFIKPIDLPIIVPEIEIKAPSCFNDQNGEISLLKINGREGIDFNLFRYQWNSGQRTSIVKGLIGAENYTVTVTDAKGCTGVASGFMRNPTPVSLTLDGVDPTCNGGNDGKIWMKNFQSEANIFSYSWNAPDQLASKDTIFNLRAGIFQLTVTNINGCKGTSSFLLKEPSPIVINQIKKGNSCYGYKEGEAEITVSGGNPDYKILWIDGNTSFKRKNLMGGIYQISITDFRNCLKTEKVEIFQPEKTELDFQLDSISCFKEADGVLSFAVFGGKGPFVYSFDKTIWQTGNRISNLASGKYTLFLKDANSCLIDTSFYIPEPPFFSIDIGNEVIKSNSKQPIILNPLLFNGQEPIKFQWSLPDSSALSCLTCRNTILTASRSMDINLIATDSKGCIAKDGLKIWVIQNRNVLIPTAFSPNNDSQNDLLIIHGADGVKILQFKIYDRLGNIVYQDSDFFTNENKRGWNGTFRQAEVPIGNYEWFCTVEYPDGYKDYLRGQTQLVR
jgi:gliding motility-associated-like protein